MDMRGKPELSSTKQVVGLKHIGMLGHKQACVLGGSEIDLMLVDGIMGEYLSSEDIGAQAVMGEEGVKHLLALREDEDIVGPVGFANAKTIYRLTQVVTAEGNSGCGLCREPNSSLQHTTCQYQLEILTNVHTHFRLILLLLIPPDTGVHIVGALLLYSLFDIGLVDGILIGSISQPSGYLSVALVA